jgi:O-antigen ligase
MMIAALAPLMMLATVRNFGHRIVIVGGAVLIVLVVLGQFADDRAKTLGRLEKALDSNASLTKRTSGRYDLMLGGWYMFLDNPLGVGTGGFRCSWAKLGPREGMSGFGYGKQKPAHSGWMKVLAENGIPGLFVLLSYVLSFAVVAWRQRDRGVLVLGLLVSATFCAALVPHDLKGKGLWFLAAGAMVLLHHGGVARQGIVANSPKEFATCA